MDLTVVDPEHVAWKGRAKALVLGINDGLYGILPGHADAVMLVSPSILKITQDGEMSKSVEFFVSGGCVKVQKNTVTLLADTVEAKDTIDTDRAEKAAERARKRLADRAEGIDLDRARLALNRALARIKLAQQ